MPKKKGTGSKAAASEKTTTFGAASGSSEKAPNETKHNDGEWDSALPVEHNSDDFKIPSDDGEEEGYKSKGKERAISVMEHPR